MGSARGPELDWRASVTDSDQNLRGLDAVSASEAWVSGESRSGGAAGIFHTTDGGRTWQEAFRNDDPTAFYNCMAFYPAGRRGLAVSDPVDDRIQLAAPDDGGRTWEVLPDTGMVPTEGEAQFSSSGDYRGSEGTSLTRDGGKGCERVTDQGFHTLDCTPGGTCWGGTAASRATGPGTRS